MKKIKQDFSSLVLKFEKIIEEEEGKEVSNQFRTNIGKLNLDEMKHAHDIIHQLNCHIGMLPIDISAVPARINSFLYSYCKELQGNTMRPTCGGSYLSINCDKQKFYIGPAISGTSSLPAKFLEKRFFAYMTVEDLIRLYSFDLSSKNLTIDGMDCLEYNNQSFGLDTPLLEILDMSRFLKFYFNFSRFYDEETGKLARTTSDDRDVDELLKFIEGDQTGEKKKKKQKKKRKPQKEVKPADKENEKICSEKSAKDENDARKLNSYINALKLVISFKYLPLWPKKLQIRLRRRRKRNKRKRGNLRRK